MTSNRCVPSARLLLAFTLALSACECAEGEPEDLDGSVDAADASDGHVDDAHVDATIDSTMPMDAMPDVVTTTCNASQYDDLGTCKPLTVCTATQFETVAPTATSNRQCQQLTLCTAGQYQSVAPTATSDRQCATTRTCTGSEYESTPPTPTTDRVCFPIRECTASEYQTVAPTPTSNRVCAQLTTCTTNQYQSTAPTATSNRVCSPLTVCTASQYQTTAPTPTSNRVCSPLTVCTASQFQSVPPTATSDRTCSPVTTCTVGVEYQVTAPTATSDRVCGAVRTCTENEYESSPPTATSNRGCSPLRICTGSEYQSTPPTPTSNRVCSPLTVCEATQYESVAPTATSNRTCSPLTVCTASQYQTVAPTLTTNRECAALRVCTAAEYQTVAPTFDTNRQCAPLTVCTGGQYQSVPPTSISDRVCAAITACTAGQYEVSPPTSTANRVCATVRTCTAAEYETAAPTATSNRTCAPLTVCEATQYESVPATATSNRVCSPLTNCIPGMEYQLVAPTATSNRMCAPLRVCTMSEYQTVAPTAESNRQCAALTVCDGSQYQSMPPTQTSDRVCALVTSCNGSQYEAAAPTPTSNRVCNPISTCTASQYESAPPTATSDRGCTTYPTNAAVLFDGPNRTGTPFTVSADVADLGAFKNLASSMYMPPGYVLYGASLTSNGGDLSNPITVTTENLGALADTWDSVIFRTATEPAATVYLTNGGTPKTYPSGTFPSLGATNDTINGISLPNGLSFLGYDDNNYSGTERASYVGPLNVGQLPYVDVWSSFIIRATTATDIQNGDVRFYVDANQGGTMVVLTPGQYPSIIFPGVGDMYNKLSSFTGRAATSVWGFAYSDYGGNVYRYASGSVATGLAGNDDWDSIVIQPSSAPTITLFRDGGFTTPDVYPLVNVTDLQNLRNTANGILVPAGYIVQTFQYENYGGQTGNATWTFNAGMSVTPSDDIDSFMVRAVGAPTVTLYLNAAFGDGRVYGLGSYPHLQSVNNSYDGANVPCGIRIRAFGNTNYGGTQYTVTGAVGGTNLATVPGANDWESMIIETTTCP